MKTELILITPERAKEILRKNKKNRPLTQRLVDFYAMQMSRGEWLENGVPIIIGDNGMLLDGQHRLAAIIKSNTSHRLLIVFGAGAETFKTIDVGRNRTQADIFAIEGVKNYVKVAAAVTQHAKLSRGRVSLSASAASQNITKSELLEIYRDNPDLYQIVAKHAQNCRNRVRLITESVMSGVMAYLVEDKGYNINYVLSFFSQIHGMERAESSAVDILRNRITNDIMLGRDERASERVLVIARAWNAHVTNESLRQLKTPSRGYDFIHIADSNITNL